MKVAYLSVQTRQKDDYFSGKPEISYAGICVEDYKPFCSKVDAKINVYNKDDMTGFIDKIRYSNLVVCYSTYCFDVLDKYYNSDYPMYYDFSIFDIQDMISGEIKNRAYLETVAKSVNMHRDVSNGLAYITMWKLGKTESLKQAIRKDISILRKAFDKVMTSKVWELTDPRTDNSVYLNVSDWVKVAVSLSRDSFYQKVNIALRRIKKNSEVGGKGLPSKEFNVSTIRYIVKSKGVSLYDDSDGNPRVYMPKHDYQVPF